MIECSTNQRYLMIALVILVALQLFLAGVLGIKPSFKAGYYTSSSLNIQQGSSINLTAERKRELEVLLAPPPILTSAETAQDKDLLDEEAILDEGEGLKIPPVYLTKLPELESLTTDQRKKRFVAIVLPLVLRANLELEERRELIIKAAQDGDIEKLRQWAELYRIKTEAIDIDELRRELLLRVDQVPVSLALAQSAIESGWGTSRFAVEGNALFGQWAWSRDQGLRAVEARDEISVVRSFANLFDSTRAYMNNLNTHYSYEDFRKMRQDGHADINTLTRTLGSYSEEGEVYIDKLQSMIDVNDFTIYDSAELLSE